MTGRSWDKWRFDNKLVLLKDFLKESALIGDKVLVFSRSLYLGGLSRMNAVHKHTDHTDGTAKGDYLDTWQGLLPDEARLLLTRGRSDANISTEPPVTDDCS